MGYGFFDKGLTPVMPDLTKFTANSKIMRRSLFTVLALLSVLWLSAQTKAPASQKTNPAVQKPAMQSGGRNISITLTPLKNCKVYLGSYFGKGRGLFDSAYLDEKSHGVFK